MRHSSPPSGRPPAAGWSKPRWIPGSMTSPRRAASRSSGHSCCCLRSCCGRSISRSGVSRSVVREFAAAGGWVRGIGRRRGRVAARTSASEGLLAARERATSTATRAAMRTDPTDAPGAAAPALAMDPAPVAPPASVAPPRAGGAAARRPRTTGVRPASTSATIQARTRWPASATPRSAPATADERDQTPDRGGSSSSSGSGSPEPVRPGGAMAPAPRRRREPTMPLTIAAASKPTARMAGQGSTR